MPIKSIIKLGNKQLATPSRPVMNFSDGKMKELIRDTKAASDMSLFSHEDELCEFKAQ